MGNDLYLEANPVHSNNRIVLTKIAAHADYLFTFILLLGEPLYKLESLPMSFYAELGSRRTRYG